MRRTARAGGSALRSMTPNSPQSTLPNGGVTRRNFPRIRVKLLMLKAAGGRQAEAGGGGIIRAFGDGGGEKTE